MSATAELLLENARTEEQARASLCVQRMREELPPLPTAHCMGSRCMAWRWYDSVREATVHQTPRRGYCGMAGPA